MISLTKHIFINENENLFEVLAKKEINVGVEALNHLKFISNKQGNNNIGYYQFWNSEEYYKIYILPKITPVVDDDKQNKQNFISILKKYYYLKIKYELKTYNVNRSIIDYSINNDKNPSNSDDFEEFIHYQYLEALATIKTFFKNHNKAITKELKFISQNVKSKINLRDTIIEIDKSKIHQQKKVPYLYSKYAIITNEVLRFFIKNKSTRLHHLKSQKEAKKLKIKIASKYQYDQNYTFKIADIISKKIIKLFKSNEEKNLQLALMKLLGIESYFEDKSNKELLKLHHQHAFFFSPEKLFEWAVQNKLEEEYAHIIKEPSTTKNYYINSTPRKSKPDFIVKNNEDIIVVDAKWKVLKSVKGIEFSDIAKLRRDALINKATKAILFYPIINFEEKNLTMSVDNFSFEVRELSLYSLLLT